MSEQTTTEKFFAARKALSKLKHHMHDGSGPIELSMEETKAIVIYVVVVEKAILGSGAHSSKASREGKRADAILEDILSGLLALDHKLIDYHKAGGDVKALRQHFDHMINEVEVEFFS